LASRLQSQILANPIRQTSTLSIIDIKEISTKHLLDISSWLDINQTSICCIKTLRCILLILEVLVFLDGYRVKFLQTQPAKQVL
jgi:hypothetical protein